MDSAINSRKGRARDRLRLGDVASLARVLEAEYRAESVPLLVVRLRDLERIAWREGRTAARAVERRSLRSFIEMASRSLRATDLLAHDSDSEDFLAALVSPTRNPGSVTTPTDCRATLARLASAMEEAGGVRVETGWTVIHGIAGDPNLSRTVESALERGARERERYDFFSTIGHELRTPLTSIRGYLETLMEEELDPGTARRFLEVARTEAMRLGRLVDGMFDISMLDLRAGPTFLEACDVRPAIDAAIGAVAPFAFKRNVSIEFDAGESFSVGVAEDRIIQICVNIFENAIKHGYDCGTVAVTIVELDARYIEIRIDDDGPGVARSERDAIFTLARRGVNARAAGSGLGLAVVRHMLERIGGEVDVTDSPLGGARFLVRLPRASPTACEDQAYGAGSSSVAPRVVENP